MKKFKNYASNLRVLERGGRSPFIEQDNIN